MGAARDELGEEGASEKHSGEADAEADADPAAAAAGVARQGPVGVRAAAALGYRRRER